MRQGGIAYTVRKGALVASLCLSFVCFSVEPVEAGSKDAGATDLIKAVRDGDIKKAKKLIKKEKEINTRDDYGWTPLMYALFREDADLVTSLLAGGADPDLADPDGVTPLMLAIMRMPEVFMVQYLPESRRAAIAIAHALVENGTNLNLADKDGNTALIYATVREQESVVAALIMKGVDPNLADLHGRTPLFFIKHPEAAMWRPPLEILTYNYRLRSAARDESGWDPEYAARVQEARTQANVDLEGVEERIFKLLTLVGGKAPDPSSIRVPEYPLFDSRPQQILTGQPDEIMKVMGEYYRYNRRAAKYHLLVCVSPEGSVTRSIVLSGVKGFSRKLSEAALKKRYQPAMKDGQPVEFWDSLVGFVQGGVPSSSIPVPLGP